MHTYRDNDGVTVPLAITLHDEWEFGKGFPVHPVHPCYSASCSQLSDVIQNTLCWFIFVVASGPSVLGWVEGSMEG